jgi:hypothetical protein
MRPDRSLLLTDEENRLSGEKYNMVRRRSSKKYSDGVYISGSDFLDVKMSRKFI